VPSTDAGFQVTFWRRLVVQIGFVCLVLAIIIGFPKMDKFRCFMWLLFLTACAENACCQFKVQGIVVDKADKTPLPGINVVEKGTENSTMTATDGTFSIHVSNPQPVLEFLFVGYRRQELQVKDSTPIVVKLKVDCIRDFFDSQHVDLYVNSGVVNTPLGGKIEVSSPVIPGGSLVKSSVAYQTNLNQNRFFNASASLEHLFVTCDYDADVYWRYRRISYANTLEMSSNTFEWHSNFSKNFRNFQGIKVIAGYGIAKVSKRDSYRSRRINGPVFGIGTWVGKPLNAEIIAKVGVYSGIGEYQGEINRSFRRFSCFVKYYRFASFDEITFGIGSGFSYNRSVRKMHRKANKK
jgi:hypothetical protein